MVEGTVRDPYLIFQILVAVLVGGFFLWQAWKAWLAVKR